MTTAPPAVLAAYTPDTHAVGGSLTGTALLGLVPLAVFFLLLMVARRSALHSALGSLVAALLVAVLGYGMPVGLSVLSATQGLVNGLFPIMLIVVAAIWFYELTVVSGRFEDLRRSFSAVGRGDLRIQAMLIAFCFGGLLEALAGFGAPVAITAAMLMSIGLPRLKAAVTVLVADTAPVAFGAMAIPITTGGSLTGIRPEDIAAVVGRQTPVLALFVPMLLLFLVDGVRGFRQLWPLALVTGGVFAVVQFWCSQHFAYELTDVVASLIGFAAAVVMLRFWTPRTPDDQRSRVEAEPLTGRRVTLAVLPYALVILIFAVAKLTVGVDMPALLGNAAVSFHWPGLYGHLLTAAGTPSTSAVYSLDVLGNPGTLLIVAGLLVMLVYGLAGDRDRFPMSGRMGLAAAGSTLRTMRGAIATVATVMSLAYVMNQSGQTVAIGTWLAAVGSVFALLSPALGWLGTAVTGSDTSANALFATLQQSAGKAAGIDPTLLVAANSSGGVVGKLVSPQNLTIAATAVEQPGSERVLLGKVFGYSVAMLALLGVLVYLQSTPVLSWMLP
ncbi:L-lactate permease [Streptomyces sp. NEAU-sy36]|uniref:L-lactate permease n=1 Tax=unclassified Streptomyces TaxID=2593676 RepID=UPI0015D5A671|nr:MULTISPECIES: L-lactate permease [unclassified Streptomyces]QLJ04313.1 L-lactate permease [Streptomyces sp. NEAU-sy36]